MDANNFNSKYQPDGEIEPILSRVSAISISNEIGDRHINPVPDCDGSSENLNHTPQMTKHEECYTSSQYPIDDNGENSDYIDKSIVFDTKLFQQGNSTIYDQSGLLQQQTAKTDEVNTNLSSQSTGVDNDESNLAKTEVCEAKSFHPKTEDNDEKRGFNFTSQYVGQMIDTGYRDTQQTSSFIEGEHKREKYFYYEPPLCEETGVWIPISVPPMSESEREEWSRGFSSNGGIVDNGCSQFLGEDKELTMWDVFIEMLLVARGKVTSITSTDVHKVSWLSTQVVEQAWREMAQTLTDANYGNTQEILETKPPKWLPDSAASTCMLCSVRFHPIMCTRHHCRFCGGIFCNDCSKGRRLLPVRFRAENPQRVCDVCCVRLESVQTYLMDQVSRAAQLPTHDLTDLSTLRSWLNFPWGQSLEYEIYKCTNTIRGYTKVGSLRPEKSIPGIILRQAKGLAILTVMKVGMMVTYNIGTGLVVARREDGSWSPPSAISSFGAGWGAQAGGELMDMIIVLRTKEAVKTFSSDVHLSVGAGLSAAVGIVGRTAEADLRAGTGGYTTCYTYSCSKGAFIGCSLEGSVVTTRTQENSRFYGSQSLNASDILLGSLPRPPAAAILYRALADLYQKL